MVTAALFDAAEYLDSREIIAAYLTEAFQSKESTFIAMAINDAIRAHGVADVIQRTGLPRESLDRVFGRDAKLEFATVLKVLHALGISLVAQTRVA